MPWLETAPMEQRTRFIDDWQRGLYTMTELCARYNVIRKTGYKWLARFDGGGRPALADRSLAPHRCPHRIPEDVGRLICEARRRHPSWGPAKLLDWLGPRHPRLAWPAVSTAGDLLLGPVAGAAGTRVSGVRRSCHVHAMLPALRRRCVPTGPTASRHGARRRLATRRI